MAERIYRFPGMDPWLEHPATWSDMHHRLVEYLADELSTRIAPRYTARHGERIYVELEPNGRRIAPDVVVTDRGGSMAAATSTATVEAPVVIELPETIVRQPHIEIRDLQSGDLVVTVVEVLSPGNKRRNTEGRAKYLQKQEEVLRSGASLVEIDLLRGGEHAVALPAECLLPYGPPAYEVVTRRASRREQAELYPIRLADRLPRVRVPLLEPDPDAVVDLQELVERAHRMGRYARTIDCAKPPEPTLEDQELTWARRLPAGAPS